MYKRRREHFVSVKEFNRHLKYVREFREVKFEPYVKGYPLNLQYAYLEDKMVYIVLTYKKGSKACTFYCRKDATTTDMFADVTGEKAYNMLRRMSDKFYVFDKDEIVYDRKYSDDNEFVDTAQKSFSASPILGFNQKFNKRRLPNCIEYDINSAYSYAMLQDMPDCSKKARLDDFVGQGEIGFVFDENGCTAVFEGRFANMIYPLMPSPFKRFVEFYYDKKKSTTGQEKLNAKGYLNFSIGYLQKKNLFLRAAIITYCNNRIKELLSKYKNNILLWNTDAIVSTCEIPELKISEEIGDWKIEHKGFFAYVNNNYQWNYDIPSYRGTPKTWFPKDFDIIKDPLPHNGNVYYLDTEKLKLKEVVYSEIQKNKSMETQS